HYLEGLLFSLIALYLSLRWGEDPNKRNWRSVSLIICAAAVAMLCKEVYVPVIPAILGAVAYRYKWRALGLSLGALVCGYALYCLWVFGQVPVLGNMALLTPGQYLKFLSKLPYTFSSNYGGYLLAATVIVCSVLCLRRSAQCQGLVLLFFLTLALSLL